MTAPTAQDVAAFLGQPEDAATLTLAAKLLPFVVATVRGYTRGGGFNAPPPVVLTDPDGDGVFTPGTTVTTPPVPFDDVALVIVASCARLVTNPALVQAETIGTYSVRHTVFMGWTLPELAILNRYRRRAL